MLLQLVYKAQTPGTYMWPVTFSSITAPDLPSIVRVRYADQ
jgi:hypothetical protein